MGTVTATRYYCGNSTPEGMDVDKGPQELAMRVILAALVDRFGIHPHKFLFSEWVHPKGGTREWRALAAMDDERWRDFKVSVAEVEEFERSPAFDFYVALMGGSSQRWHAIFRDYGNVPDGPHILESAAQRLREEGNEMREW